MYICKLVVSLEVKVNPYHKCFMCVLLWHKVPHSLKVRKGSRILERKKPIGNEICERDALTSYPYTLRLRLRLGLRLRLRNLVSHLIISLRVTKFMRSLHQQTNYFLSFEWLCLIQLEVTNYMYLCVIFCVCIWLVWINKRV